MTAGTEKFCTRCKNAYSLFEGGCYFNCSFRPDLIAKGSGSFSRYCEALPLCPVSTFEVRRLPLLLLPLPFSWLLLFFFFLFFFGEYSCDLQLSAIALSLMPLIP